MTFYITLSSLPFSTHNVMLYKEQKKNNKKKQRKDIHNFCALEKWNEMKIQHIRVKCKVIKSGDWLKCFDEMWTHICHFQYSS